MKKSILAVAVFATFMGGAYAADVIHTESTFTSTQSVSESTHRYTAENITMTANSGDDVVLAGKAGKIYIGDDQTKTVSITAKEGVGYDAVSAFASGEKNTGNLVEIKATDSIVIESSANGLWGQSNDQQAAGSAMASTISLKSDKVIIAAQEKAIVAYSNSRINVEGNHIEITGKSGTAIDARGYSTVNVNADGKAKSVVINGDIVFETPGPKMSSGDIIDAYITVNLTGEKSSWTGNASKEYPEGSQGAQTSVTGLKVTLADGAQWTPTEIKETTSEISNGNNTWKIYSKPQSLNELTFNNGVININSADQTVEVEKLSGEGGTLNVATTAKDGAIVKTGKLKVKASSGAQNLAVNLTGITADDVADAQRATQDAAKAVTGDGSKAINKKIEIAEGAVNGAITADVTGNEVGTVSQTENTKLSALNSVTAMGTMAWRHDMNDLTKRMGELRTSPEGIGSWVRLYGSEQEYGRQDVTTKSTSVQVGSDYDVGYGWKVGGAFTYTDGSSDYANGSSDNKAYGLAAYGSWLHEGGAFVDVIAKYSRLKSDFDMSVMSGTSKNNAYSASAEFGWYVPFANVAFVEPQAEITYGVVKGDDFTTSNGVAISQKDTKALIGRLGVRTGLHFNENKGVVYARASVLRDFKGESEFTASLVSDSSVRSTVKDDIGGTYYEMGIGANYKFADNAYTYVDFERQNGGDVKEKWRWNVGLRYVW